MSADHGEEVQQSQDEDLRCLDCTSSALCADHQAQYDAALGRSTGEEVQQHAVRLEFGKWGATWQMDCPFAMSDESRPCWPYQENGDRDPAPQGVCTYKDWFEEDGDVEQVLGGPVVFLPVVDADWTGDGFNFTLGSGHFGGNGEQS